MKGIADIMKSRESSNLLWTKGSHDYHTMNNDAEESHIDGYEKMPSDTSNRHKRSFVHSARMVYAQRSK